MEDRVDEEYKRHTKQLTGPCRMPGRKNVFCDTYTKCEKCGWNYFVEMKRKERIRENCS